MFGKAVEKVAEDVISKSNFAMDRMLAGVIEKTHEALNEEMDGKSAKERLELLKSVLPVIKSLARAVQRVKE